MTSPLVNLGSTWFFGEGVAAVVLLRWISKKSSCVYGFKTKKCLRITLLTRIIWRFCRAAYNFIRWSFWVTFIFHFFFLLEWPLMDGILTRARFSLRNVFQWFNERKFDCGYIFVRIIYSVKILQRINIRIKLLIYYDQINKKRNSSKNPQSFLIN